MEDNTNNNLFSKQFYGQNSYGHEDLMDHLEQLPESLRNNSNHTLQKPQQFFTDKIDNFKD